MNLSVQTGGLKTIGTKAWYKKYKGVTNMQILQDYMAAHGGVHTDQAEMLAYIANLHLVAQKNPAIAQGIIKELIDQRSYLKLIASENFCSFAIQSAMGNLLTDKYAEGFVGRRFYAGCDNVDAIEQIACDEAKKLFGCDHAYVQPHSGADANLVAFWSILRKKVQEPFMAKLDKTNLLHLTKAEWDDVRLQMGNQRMLGMDLFSGGHLTHGYRHNISGQMFDAHFYNVDPETGLLDYDALRRQLHEVKPLIFLAGFSAYSRNIDYALLRKYADEVGAVLMVDMAHFAGLVAGGALAGRYNPVPYADIVTTTTHKTLRGPRGGLVLCRAEYAEYMDKGCPHVMAAKAIAFQEANSDEYRAYAHRVIENARALAAALVSRGVAVLTGGTDNHIVLISVEALGITGTQAESAMRECGLTLNRNTLPFDKNGPWYTSGLRLGTPAVTTLGMGTQEMDEIADIIAGVLRGLSPKKDKKGNPTKAQYNIDAAAKALSLEKVKALLGRFVLYPELDGEFLGRYLV